MDDILTPGSPGKTASTSGHRSGRSGPIEIITRNARRRWSLEQKREIVAESLGPELTPTEVARRHEISSGQLYTWRRELLAMQTAMITRSVQRFAEVEMAAPPAPPVDNDRKRTSVACFGSYGGSVGFLHLARGANSLPSVVAHHIAPDILEQALEFWVAGCAAFCQFIYSKGILAQKVLKWTRRQML